MEGGREEEGQAESECVGRGTRTREGKEYPGGRQEDLSWKGNCECTDSDV